MDAGRVPPQSLEAERAVIGSLLLNNGLVPRVAALLEDDAFYSPRHRVVYRTILDLHVRGEVADIVTVGEALKVAGTLEKAGGAAYIGDLTDRVPSAEAAEHYAQIVLDRAARRYMIAADQRTTQAAYDGADLDVLRDMHYATAARLTPRNARLADARTIVDEFLLAAERAHVAEEAPGLTTGLPDLDLVVRLHPGDLVIVAGRPGQGKTAFGLGVTDANLEEGKRVLWSSLELGRSDLLCRLAAARGGVAVEEIRNGRVSDEDWPKVTGAAGQLAGTRLFVDDTPGVSSAHVRAEAQRVQATFGLDLVVVDYVGLMEEPGRYEARRLEIAKISRNLVSTAKNLGVPVLLLCQLNRECEGRDEHRPYLSDLRESGDLEQDADVVLLLNRPEVAYEAQNKPTPPEKRGLAEIHVAKNRHGRTGVVDAFWHGPTNSFRPIERRRT